MAFLWATNDTKDRFSLLSLEPGEIYFQDFGAVLYPLEVSEDEMIKRCQKGWLKICSKSVVFDPTDVSHPVLKISYTDMTNLDNFQPGLLSKVGSSDRSLVIETKQVIEMKTNKIIAPYDFIRMQRRMMFTLSHSSVEDCLPYMCQLRRASMLPATEQNAMISVIVMSRQNRHKFDTSRLDDLYETIVKEALADHITPLVVNPGRLLLTSSRIYFQPFNNATSLLKIRHRDVQQVIKRRFLLRNQALEIYSKEDVKTSCPHLYVCFKTDAERDEVYSLLLQQEELKLEDFEQKNMTLRWQNRSISNFEYLMYLNSQADRSINDLTQYPVFPWVIADYTSPVLDLDDERVYRDLSKPIGALNPERLKKLQERYHEMPEPRFLYGSHYSSPAHVLFYLARAAPEYMLCLQNGRFDHPDRMFNSIMQAYRNCLTSMSDFKELIPEFYESNGEFLQNLHQINFGVRSNGHSVNKVELPLWAQGPKDFIAKMRQALESEYTSTHLHQWIDLIFGYKQQGEEAALADNVFVHLTYEGAINLENVQDASERAAFETQIMEFGQTPKQLFTFPHPQRSPPDKQPLDGQPMVEDSANSGIVRNGTGTNSAAEETTSVNFTKLGAYEEHSLHRQPVMDVRWCANGSNVISAAQDGLIKLYDVHSHKQLHSSSPSSMPISSFVLMPGEKTVVAGSWDNNIYVYSMEYGRTTSTLPAHDDAISQMTASDNLLVSCSWDSTAKLWSCAQNGRELAAPKIQAELEHDIGVNCVCLGSQNTRLVSGTCDGQVYIWDPESLQTITRRQAHLQQICSICFSPDNRQLLSCGDDGFLKIYDMSTGTEVFAKNANCQLKCASWTGQHIVTGTDSGQLLIWDITLGEIVHTLQAHEGAVMCLHVGENNSLCTGGADRKVMMWNCST